MAESAALEILVAPAGSGKTMAALGAYRQTLRYGANPERFRCATEGSAAPLNSGELGLAQVLATRRRTLWLAPTQAAAADVRDALVDGGDAVFLDPGVTTFAGFAAEVVWDAGQRVRVVSALERRRLVHQVIREAAVEGALTYFGRVADSTGLVNLVDETIAGLKRRDVPPEANRRSSRTASPRRRELAELYARYENRLATAKLLDAEGLFLAARDAVRSTAAVATGLELVVVDGFTDFTPAQLGILQILTERAHRVIVTLPGEGGEPLRPELFVKTRATAESLRKMGAVDSTLLAAETSDALPSARPAFSHLERNLFRNYGELDALPSSARQSLQSIEIVAASSVQGEIEEIARRVKRLLLDGAAPGDVVVAFRSTREVADRMRLAFDDFGIPTHLDAPRRLTSTRLVRSLLAVLRLHAEDWPYRRLLQVVGDQSLSVFASPPLAEQWPSERADAKALQGRAAVESCIRHAQLPSGRRLLMEQVAAWAADTSDLDVVDAETAAMADALLRPFAEHLEELPAHATLEEWLSAVEHLMQRFGLLGDLGANQEAVAVWRALTRGLRSVGRIDLLTSHPGKRIAAGEFVELMAAVAGELPAPERRDPTGRVRVISAEAARFVRPRHLFVAGLSEQSFPAPRRGNSRPAEDDAAEEPDNSSPDNSSNDEMLLFYQLVTRPSETLTLSYPALDAKAQPMPASPFLIELERCFAGELIETRQPLGRQAEGACPPLSRSELRRQAIASAQERKREPLAALVRSPRYGQLGQSLLDGIEAVAHRSDRRVFGAFEGLFTSDAVRAILERKFGPDHLWSPSKLETYAACPFRFFGEQVLKLAPAPELALESDMARRGSVLHDTLARLYGRLNAAAEEGAAAPTPELVAQRFQETLDAIVHSRPRRGIDGVLREIERRQIAAWAEKFAKQHEEYGAAWQHLDAPLSPRYFEARFGPKHRRNESVDDASLSTEKPFELTIGNEQMRFIGQIDRIDVGRVGDTMVFNVVDYKTSAHARVDQGKIEAGLQIQLPLYAMAAAELMLANKQAAALSAGFWSIRGKGFGANARSGGPLMIGEIRDGKVEMAAGWSQLRETLLARIAEIVAGIRGGHFPVFNEDKACGQYCPFSTGCRVAHVRSLEKSWPPEKPLT